jgi:hypothetical protein
VAALDEFKEKDQSAFDQLIAKAGQYKKKPGSAQTEDWIFRKRFLAAFGLEP